MNEQERIRYIKGLSDNNLMNDITYDDVKFLIDIVSRYQRFASEFDPIYTERQMNEYAKAYEEVMKEDIKCKNLIMN